MPQPDPAAAEAWVREHAGTLAADQVDERIASLELDPRDRARLIDLAADLAREARNDRGDLTELLDAVRAYIDITPAEESYIVAALAIATAKALTDEEPTWLMLNGPSGGGKSEAIRLLAPLADQTVDELTRAGLLSWSVGKKARPVGILTRIPSVALLTISDFSTVITMGDREARARMYSMLRVVYDGAVYRGIGGEPATEGAELAWQGHLTLIAGVTPAIDAHSSFEAALGERWLTVRLPESNIDRARERARFVMKRHDVPEHRTRAQTLTERLITSARTRIPDALPPHLSEQLLEAAVLVATARAGVLFEGQGKHRIPIGIPTPEEPTRLVGQLHRLARCATALGLTPAEATNLAIRTALDSIPHARRKALHAVATNTDATVTAVHRGLGRGNRWAAIHELDALEAIGLIDVDGPNRDTDPNATRIYRLAHPWNEVYENVALPRTSPPNTEETQGNDLHIRTPHHPSKGRQP